MKVVEAPTYFERFQLGRRYFICLHFKLMYANRVQCSRPPLSHDMNWVIVIAIYRTSRLDLLENG